jgi:N6-adenosine-specific RNA methylase IME4
MEEKTYSVIYADPPWRYDFSKSDTREIEGEYKTMDINDIMRMKIPSAKNSVLYMWATAPKLLEALDVIDAWGFTYKTHAIWDKEILGMGYWFRGQHELLLVATKGTFSPPAEDVRIGSVIRQKRGKHSQKPMSFRDMISKWFPIEEKLELFARSREGFFPDYEYEGWSVYGNQVNNSIKIKL